MSKVLKVVKPFFVVEAGDTFELSQDGTEYTCSYNEEHNESSDTSNVVTSKYTSNYTISTDYAKMLIEEGYLQEVGEKKPSSFVNVFDEISDMLGVYKEELDNIDEDMASAPACLKIERETVLSNLITALEHLNSLKK